MTQRLVTRKIANSIFLNDTTTKVASMATVAATQDIWDGGGSIEFWFYANSAGQSNIGRIINVSTKWYIDMGNDTTGTIRLYVFFDGADGRWRIATAPTAFFRNWHHVVITYNADDVANDPVFYFDGVSKAITEIGAPTGTRTSDVGTSHIFGNQGSGTVAFDGYLTMFRYFNRILTSNEVTGLYYQNNVPADAIIEEWDFSEGTGTTVAGTYGVKDLGLTAASMWNTFSPSNLRTLATNRTQL